LILPEKQASYVHVSVRNLTNSEPYLTKAHKKEMWSCNVVEVRLTLPEKGSIICVGFCDELNKIIDHN
jgi:hypothetical protein